MAPQIQPGPVIGHGVAKPPVDTSEKGGTINTAAGPLKWSRASNGIVNANGNGQQLTITPTEASDGSSQSKAVFSRAGQAPYLTIQSLVQPNQNAVTLTLTGGQSHLTLALRDLIALSRRRTRPFQVLWRDRV
jgi:hypothetical protein